MNQEEHFELLWDSSRTNEPSMNCTESDIQYKGIAVDKKVFTKGVSVWTRYFYRGHPEFRNKIGGFTTLESLYSQVKHFQPPTEWRHKNPSGVEILDNAADVQWHNNILGEKVEPQAFKMWQSKSGFWYTECPKCRRGIRHRNRGTAIDSGYHPCSKCVNGITPIDNGLKLSAEQRARAKREQFG